MFLEEHKESEGGTCHDTGTHQNTEHDNQEDCESAGYMWIEEGGHGHDSEYSLSNSIGDVIEEIEDGDINATTGILEIEESVNYIGPNSFP